ncbi:DNA cytosine methyltransferase [Bizionia argentinensis JUB59]|uniref:Cytosine-specific methyltransferase n=1 Tax=Bizionia argentinensis JUB59 TaxID=1046627 RepID=G2EDY4_9FLAO|nr:DNA cytosine methyltransferase [Bizionia argentinensis]EGV43416.1 DNA cytosine methyltransferase [Bizionia argentinensis JUB59]
MQVVDLFSGCGGLALGFKWAGFNTLLASDVDENCEKTYTHNFPNVPFIRNDLRDISTAEIKSIISRTPDVVIGGPPCQGFSLANKNRNKVKSDPRNELFYEFVRVVTDLQPKAFVMENVRGLLSMQKGEVIKLMKEEFENAGIGYQVDYKVLLASDYGVPQNRHRVIMIGIRKDLEKQPLFPNKTYENPVTVWEAISDLPQIKASEGDEKMMYETDPENNFQEFIRQENQKVYNHIAMRHTQRLINRFQVIKAGESLAHVSQEYGAVKRGNPKEKSKVVFSQNNQRLRANKPAPTIAASFQSNFIHPFLHRNFTAREGARLQSFPDNFIFQGMRTKMSWEKGLSQYQQIGNAVPPLLGYAIAKALQETLMGTESLNKKLFESLKVTQ